MGVKVYEKVAFNAQGLREAIMKTAVASFDRATEAGAIAARTMNPDDTYETERSIDAQVNIKGGKITGSIGTSSGHGVWTEIGTDEVKAARYLRKGLRRGIKVMIEELSQSNA